MDQRRVCKWKTLLGGKDNERRRPQYILSFSGLKENVLKRDEEQA